MWNLANQRLTSAPWAGHAHDVSAIAFSADGKTMASGSCWKVGGNGACREGEILLWDLASQRALSPPLRAHGSQVGGLAFGHGTQTLASWSGENHLIVWTIGLDFWKEQACRKANRNLSPEEWQQVLPDERYRKTCANIP